MSKCLNFITLYTGACAPFLVGSSPHVGRKLLASRKIGAGEMICQEEPIVVGPNQVCLRMRTGQTEIDC
jgi:hypothetical protein